MRFEELSKMKITPGVIVAQKYTIEKAIGEGATGIVYLAKDNILSKHVAIKFLRREFSLSVEQRKRFLNEARVASHFVHESVVAIREVSEWKSHLYIVMDYHEGKTLKEFMRDKELTMEEILSISQQLLKCLQAAHTKNIVHRDIKPSNLMVYFDKNNKLKIKVLDFGLAYCDEFQSNAHGGTLNYVSPEQLLDDPVDHRSDLYSVAVCIYEMYTGVLPVSGETAHEFVYNLLERNTDKTVKRPLKSGLKKVLMKGLSSDPEQRYQNALHFWEELKVCGRYSFYEIGKKAAIVAAACFALWLLSMFWDGRSQQQHYQNLLQQAQVAYQNKKYDEAIRLAQQSQQVSPNYQARSIIQKSTFAKIRPILTQDLRVLKTDIFSEESIELLKRYFQFYPTSEKIASQITKAEYRNAIQLIQNYEGLPLHKNLLAYQLKPLILRFYRQQLDKAIEQRKLGEMKRWYGKLKDKVSPEERKELKNKIQRSSKNSDYEEAMYSGDYWKAAKIAKKSISMPFWLTRYNRAQQAFQQQFQDCYILSPTKGKVLSQRVVKVHLAIQPNINTRYLRVNDESLEYLGNVFSAEVILDQGTQSIRLEYQRQSVKYVIHEIKVSVDIEPPRLKVHKSFIDEKNKEIVLEGSVVESTRLDTVFYKNFEAQPLNAAFDKWQMTIPLDRNLNEIPLTAKDIAGNTSTYTHKLDVDQTPPEVYIEYPKNNQKMYTNNFTLVGIAIDDSKIENIRVFSKKVSDFRRDKWYAPISLPKNIDDKEVSIPIEVTDIWGNVKKHNIVVLTEYRNWQDMRLFKKIDMHNEMIWGLCYDHEGKYLISAGNDGKRVVWDTRSYRPLTVGFTDIVTSSHLKMSPAIRFTSPVFASVAGKSTSDFSDHTEVGGVWYVDASELEDRDLGDLTRFFDNHISCTALSPDGRYLAMGHHSGNLRIIDLQEQRYILHSNNVHKGVIMSLCYSPDNKWLASGGGDYKVKIWPVRESYRKNFRATHTLKGHRMSVTALSFSHNSEVLASGSKDKKVYIWNVENGTKIKRLSGHTSRVESVSFSPVDMTLCTTSYQGEMFIWK